MNNITFLSNQNNETFPLNTPTKFSVLLNHRKQDTNQHHHAHRTPQSLTLTKLLVDVEPPPVPEARLCTLTCSLVRNRTWVNAKATNVYKIICLAPVKQSGLGYTFDFRSVDPLPLLHNEGQVQFELSTLNPSHQHRSLEQTVYLNQFPTVLNFVTCPTPSPWTRLTTTTTTTTSTMSRSSESDQYKIVLNSVDANSGAYRENTAVDFEGVLELPFNTVNEDWSIELSSIFIHRRVFGTFPLTVKPEHLKFRLMTVTKPAKAKNATTHFTNFTWDRERTFHTAHDLLRLINDKLSEYSRLYGHAKFQTVQQNKVRWHYDTQKTLDEAAWNKFEDTHPRKQQLLYADMIDVIALLPKDGLGQLLGFAAPGTDKGDVAFSLWSNAHRHKLKNADASNKDYVFTTTEAPHLSFRYPLASTNSVNTPLAVTCNLVENSLLGCRHIRLLRLLTVNNRLDQEPYMGHEEFAQSHPVKLETKTFSSIRIQLCNLHGDIMPIAANVRHNPNINTVVMLTLRRVVPM